MLTAMLVDDNVSLRATVRYELLSHFPSLRVVEASRGDEVFSALAIAPIDLILMDIRLGEENGLDLTRKIKSVFQDNAVLVLSGYDLPEYREEAVRCGANGFLTKGTDNVLEKIVTVFNCFQRAKEGGRAMPGCLWHFQTG